MSGKGGGIVRVQKRDDSYTILDPYFLSDDRLTWKAKGLLGYLLSKPSNWRVYVSDLVKRSKDGRDAVYSALNELEAAGYIDRKQTRENGKITGMETVVYERPIVPVTENPEVVESSYPENPDMAESDAEKAEHNSIDLNNIDFKIDDDDARGDFIPDLEQGSKRNNPHDTILSALSAVTRTLHVTPDVTLYDGYFVDVYSALIRHFGLDIDVDTLSTAGELYYRTAAGEAVRNPPGLFVDSYRQALAGREAERFRRRSG